MDSIIDFDKFLFQLINHDWSNPFFDHWMPILTDLHKQILVTAVLLPLIVAIWVFKQKTRALKTIVMVGLAVALSDTVSYRIIKPLVDRPRPAHSGMMVTMRTQDHSGRSFPSNHAANNFAAATILSFVYTAYWPIFFFIAAVIAYSRIYVGVHFPLDVLGGAFVGWVMASLLWTYLGHRWFAHKEKKKFKFRDPLAKPEGRRYRD